MSDSAAPQSCQILLVEDSPADRLLLERLFSDRVTVTADAEAALQAVRRQSFAAIVLAQSLPRRTGLDVLRDLRAAGDTTPVVLMTEGDDESLREAAADAGATAVVVKEAGFEEQLAAMLAGGGARPETPEAVRVVRETRHVLVFEIDGQRHGLFAADVVTVSRAVTIAHMPSAPAGIEGYVEYRGRLVPVVDLRSRLGLEPKVVDETEHLIVARGGKRLLAARTDRAIALVRVEASRLEPCPELTTAGVTAVARLPEGPVFVHDLGIPASSDARRRPLPVTVPGGPSTGGDG